MWGSIKTIVAQYCTYNQEETEQKTTDDIDGWVFVDKTGKEIEKETVDAQLFDSPRRLAESRLNPLPLLDISNTSSAQSSPQLSPTKIEEGWLIAPPPCFTLNCPSIEISPLEDLLIEHPSMSVYRQFPNYILHNKKAEKEILITGQSKIEVESEPKEELMAVSLGNAGVQNELVTSHYNLAELMNGTENMKPAQQAKWENDQFKLCPSYMTRQNRVHRYQSRKHHNQKKKSLAKPFAEKGRHSF